jgi:hypothetical protein
MKRMAMLVTLGLAITPLAFAADAPPKNTPLDRLKSLEGTWTGTAAWNEGGQKGTGDVTVVYKVTAAGSAVQEVLFPGTPHEMVTMYHMDGSDLVLTHYCAAGNQPRMKLQETKEPNVLSFGFAGGTNMKESDRHMHAARITLADADHVKGVWTSMEAGKPVGEASFDLARKK